MKVALPTPVALFGTILILAGLPTAKAEVDFTRDIRPLLSGKCFACHGSDEDARAGGLGLDEFSAATQERNGKRAITPGRPAASELIARIKTDDAIRRMPLGGEALEEAQIKLLEEWISEGAEYKRHWAYEKPQRPEVPAVSSDAWPRNPIDRFILSKLEAEGLQPSAEAEAGVLMRRLYLDLTGIPPTPEQIDGYLANPTSEAYLAKVEELLASPQYGEQWARHWLDLARYADSNGYQHDDMREIWPYRDWVIKAQHTDQDAMNIRLIIPVLLALATPISAAAFEQSVRPCPRGAA